MLLDLAASESNASELMERIVSCGNLAAALLKVARNKGAPGVDGRSVEEVVEAAPRLLTKLGRALLEGSYQPQAVRGVEIPKVGGSGKRQLGIPTVVDRLVQQAILQVLEGILEPIFSESSYGFRPGRSAHQAVQKGAEYVAGGRGIVVDLDLEKFFD